MDQDPKEKKGCQCGMNKGDDEQSLSTDMNGFTRRGFMASMAAGSAALVMSGKSAHAEKNEEMPDPESMTRISLMINGKQYKLLVEPRWNLLFVIREKLGLTATKIGCERGECGACTVLINNQPKYACMILAMEAEGQEITTLEGLMDGENLGTTQEAFLENDAFQCGYCTPGQIVAVEGLLRTNPEPTDKEIRLGMSGNLCRCGTYNNIFKAAKMAKDLRSGKGGK